MTATAQKIEQAFKELPREEQAGLLGHVETIFYGDEEGDRIAFERDRDIEQGKVTPISEQEVWRRVGGPPL